MTLSLPCERGCQLGRVLLRALPPLEPGPRDGHVVVRAARGVAVDRLAGEDLAVRAARAEPEGSRCRVQNRTGDPGLLGDLQHRLLLTGHAALVQHLLAPGDRRVTRVEREDDRGVDVRRGDRVDVLLRDRAVDRVVDRAVRDPDLGHVPGRVGQGRRSRRVHQERRLVVDRREPVEVRLERLAELGDDLDEERDPREIGQLEAAVPEPFCRVLVDLARVVVLHNLVLVVEDRGAEHGRILTGLASDLGAVEIPDTLFLLKPEHGFSHLHSYCISMASFGSRMLMMMKTSSPATRP